MAKASSEGKGDGVQAKEEFELFYTKESPFSQHFMCDFSLQGIVYNCAEQYMMHQKAVVFKDDAMAQQILSSADPVKQKSLGRKVQNFDREVWSQRSLEVVKAANLAKFSQNPDLLKTLLATHPRTLVEAAPRDCIWGIGLGANNPKARDRSQWRGRNLLGQILTEVREELRQEEEKGEEEETKTTKEAKEEKKKTKKKAEQEEKKTMKKAKRKEEED